MSQEPDHLKDFQPEPTTMQYATNDGVDIAYEREGPPDAETVVFVEGIGYGRWMWLWQQEALVDEYQTIVWDNRGTGDSDEPEGPYTMGQMAGDLEAVLDDAGIEQAHVVGASMGGMIAQQYALEYDRAQSLTLMCTSPGGPEARPVPEETQQRMFAVPDDLDERELRRYKMQPALSESFMDAHEDLIERIVDWRIDSDASDRALEWQGAAVQAFDASDRLREITEPCLVIHGTADEVVPYENGELLARGLPNADFVTVHGGPHLLFIEEYERVNTQIREFIDDV
ncbi:alpha/beta fold hydrolase [Haloarcula sp. Atlit-120R]|uniref:alpha/beta fold hydrolase n=1 Tax=Haloarcula sp. Atlit-120R TaxID=2282135 RepID=UPI000EF1C535|nr:alpha/beta hydrolase [Haloarcula sp. Atlit-120R]RLM33513.1 alpha/beta fold hydrolase [Haloarcula sp. Atlit-120R]